MFICSIYIFGHCVFFFYSMQLTVQGNSSFFHNGQFPVNSLMMQNWLNCHSWRHKFWSTHFFVFSVQRYIRQQNPVTFSTLYACHTSVYIWVSKTRSYDWHVNCYYDYTVNDVLWKDHEDGFHSQGLMHHTRAGNFSLTTFV